MADSPRPSTQAALRNHFPDVFDTFGKLRRAVDAAGPLDTKTRELILLAGFTVGRQEGGYRAHCKRAMDAGATAEEVRQATVICLGATAAIELVADALSWADEVIAAHGSSATVPTGATNNFR